MATLAEAAVRLYFAPDDRTLTSQAKAKITSGLRGTEPAVRSQVTDMGRRHGDSMGRSMGAGLTNAVRRFGPGLLAAFGGLGVVAIFRQVIGGASDLNETINKSNVVFGAYAKNVQAAFKDAPETMGQTTQQANEAAATLGNMFLAMGSTAEQSGKMSVGMVKLASDMASFNNANPAEVLEAIRSGLVGEYEPLRRYGVQLSEAGLKQEAMRLGLGKIGPTLTTQQRMQAAYSLILKQTTTAQGDFARTSTGMANQQRILSAQLKDFAASLGAILLPIATKVFGFLTSYAVPALDELVDGLKGMSTNAGGFAGAMNDVGNAMRDAVSTVRDVVSWVRQYHEVFEGAAIAASVLTLAIAAQAVVIGIGTVAFRIHTEGIRGYTLALIKAVMPARVLTATMALLNLATGPIGLVVLAIAALVAGFIYAYTHSERFRKIVWAAIRAVGDAASWMWDKAKVAFNGLRDIWNVIIGVAQGFWNAVVGAFNAVIGAAIAFHSGVVGAVTAVVGVVLNLWHGVFDPAFRGIASVALWLWGTIIYPVFTLIRAFIQATFIIIQIPIRAAIMFWQNVLVPAIQFVANIWIGAFTRTRDAVMTAVNFIRAVLQNIIDFWRGVFAAAVNWVYTNLFAPVWQKIRALVDLEVRGLRIIWQSMVDFWNRYITPALLVLQGVFRSVWNGIQLIMTTIWVTGIRPLWNSMVTFLTVTLPNAFSRVAAAVSTAWNTVKNAAKVPVEFIVNKVINGAIIDNINRVASFFKISQRIDHVALPSGWATGGRIPGRASNEDNQLAMVATGEFIVNARQTAKYLPILESINEGTMPGFALGGIVGGVLSGALNFLTNPIKWVTDKVGLTGLLNQIDASPFVNVIKEAPKWVFTKFTDWVKDKMKTMVSAILPGAIGPPVGSGGPGSAWMVAVLRQAFPGISIYSTYRPGDMAESGLSYHAYNRAVDMTPNMAIFNWIRAMYGSRTRELIYSPAGYNQIWNGKPHLYTGAALVAAHFNHIHWAMHQGGLLGHPRYSTADSGLLSLAPGGNYVYNGTGSREDLFGGDALSVLVRMANRLDVLGQDVAAALTGNAAQLRHQGRARWAH